MCDSPPELAADFWIDAAGWHSAAPITKPFVHDTCAMEESFAAKPLAGVRKMQPMLASASLNFMRPAVGRTSAKKRIWEEDR
jgi:hypothetical protein